MDKIWMKNWPDFLPKDVVYPKGEKPLFEYLRDNARAFPDRTAINFYGRELTYGELDAMSERFTHFLIDSGFKSGDRIALFLQSCPQYHIAYYGITKMGGVMVPCSPVFKEWELTYQLKDSGARAIVTLDLFHPVATAACKECAIETIILTSLHDYLPKTPTINLIPMMNSPKMTHPGTIEFLDILSRYPSDPVQVDVDLDEVVQLQYTGGTTGLPKGAILTHRAKLFKVAAVMNILDASMKVLGHQGEVLSCLSPYPIFNIAGQLRSVDAMIGLGTTQVLLSMYDPIAAMQAIDRYRIEYFHTTVPMIIGIINHPERKNYDLSSLILTFTSSLGVQLTADMVRQWKEITGRCVLAETGYGLSETHTGDTFMPIDKPKLDPGCVGIPIAGAEVKIVTFEDKGREVPLGEIGEIAVRHPAVFKGYWNRPEETKKTLIDGWVHTGDMGRFDEDGYLYFLGRNKDMIKTSGFSVFPEEVELFLYRHEAVEKAAVIGVPDEKKGEIIKAYVVPKACFRKSLKADDIIAWMKQGLSPYKVPKSIEFREEIPMSGVGKVLRRVLLEEELKKKEMGMSGRFNALLEGLFKIREYEGKDKVMDLQEAVARYVKPGAKIHFTTTHSAPGAAILEIARQFRGQKPEFTILARGMRDTIIILLHMGLVKKVITTFSGNVYPWYSPTPVAQKAYVGKAVELEEWTVLTMPLRLMAGAMGIGVMPTTSLVGSSLAEANKDAFTVIDDPFGSGQKIGLLKALNPDISIVHGLAADREGNTIMTAPYSESLWGAKASTSGVIVTVEHLVSSDFIREHSHLVKLPAYMVNSVSVVPFGSHPGGVWNQGIRELDAYAEDYAFMTEFNRCCKDPASLDAWVREWVVECPSFEDYRAKLGRDRLLYLKGNADPDAWTYHLQTLEKKISDGEDCTQVENMVIMAARELQDRIPRLGHKTILAGAGTANLAAWVAKYRLQAHDYLVELMVELGYFGNSPRPAEPFLLNFGNFSTCKMLTETLDTMGVFTCGAQNRCIGVLGAGQIDKFGNINSNWMSRDLYMTGSGGANDVATGATESMVIMKQSRQRFLERVPFITAPGDRVNILVSSLGVFEKLNGDKEFTLTKYFVDRAGTPLETAVRKIKENCGWDLKVIRKPQKVVPPAADELKLLRLFDPQKFYIK